VERKREKRGVGAVSLLVTARAGGEGGGGETEVEKKGRGLMCRVGSR